MNPVGLYAECSTMATIVILFVYFLTMVSLPVFMWRRHRASFSPVRHVAIPALGSVTLIVPFVELCQPGQPAPYSAFPFIALAIGAVAAAAAFVVVRRRPRTGTGEGTEVAGCAPCRGCRRGARRKRARAEAYPPQDWSNTRRKFSPRIPSASGAENPAVSRAARSDGTPACVSMPAGRVHGGRG